MFVLLAILITIIVIPTFAIPVGLAAPAITAFIDFFLQNLEVLQNIFQTLS